MKFSRTPLLVILLSCSAGAYASSGTEGAAFLDIPVGAGPAALGSAYTALAQDAYAPTYNPAGLGFLPSLQFAGQHLSYIDTLHYEYLSFAVPLRHGSDYRNAALGGSIQYLGTGDVTGMDKDGNPTGTITGSDVAYNLAYGHKIGERLSLGLTGKVITSKLASVSAQAYAADLGGMYKALPNLQLAATLTNLGSKLKFISEGDPLPMAAHLAAAYQPASQWLLAVEGVYPKTGLASFRAGGEWRPLEMISLRTGYRTDTLKGLSALAGFSTGIGVHAWGHEVAYSWLPYGDLGNTHYISLVMKMGEDNEAKRNLIQYQRIKMHRTAESDSDSDPDPGVYQQLLELLNDTEQHLVQGTPAGENQ